MITCGLPCSGASKTKTARKQACCWQVPSVCFGISMATGVKVESICKPPYRRRQLIKRRKHGLKPLMERETWHTGRDYATARALYEESLAIRRELGDKNGIADSLSNLGEMAKEQGDYAAARALYEESLAIRRELGDKYGIRSEEHTSE